MNSKLSFRRKANSSKNDSSTFQVENEQVRHFISEVSVQKTPMKKSFGLEHK